MIGIQPESAVELQTLWRLLEPVERSVWKTIPDSERGTRRYEEYARATFRKDRRVNIRISERDLVKIRKKALEEGLPYQALISSLLHRHVGGRLVRVRLDPPIDVT